MIEQITKSTGFLCQEAGKNSYRVTTPFSLGVDGKLLSFFVAFPSKETYFITDAGETIMYAEHLGMNMTKGRINSINNTSSVSFARIDDDGCVVSDGDVSDLTDAIWDYIKINMAILFKKEMWQPKFNQVKFKNTVFNELTAQIGAEKVIRKVKAKAFSGNIIEFPIGIKLINDFIYVVPIALDAGKFNWTDIYKAQGQFVDIKAISDINNRVAILEQQEDKKEQGKVENFLLQTSKVETFNQNKNWNEVFGKL